METEKEQAVPGFSKEYLEKQSRIISELHNIPEFGISLE